MENVEKGEQLVCCSTRKCCSLLGEFIVTINCAIDWPHWMFTCLFPTIQPSSRSHFYPVLHTYPYHLYSAIPLPFLCTHQHTRHMALPRCSVSIRVYLPGDTSPDTPSHAYLSQADTNPLCSRFPLVLFLFSVMPLADCLLTSSVISLTYFMLRVVMPVTVFMLRVCVLCFVPDETSVSFVVWVVRLYMVRL